MGFSTATALPGTGYWYSVAIPFRVGWGFQLFRKWDVGPRNGVAIPFRVGWGFQRGQRSRGWLCSSLRRNPFQGGVGFSTGNLWTKGGKLKELLSQSLSGWGGVFNKRILTPSKFSKLCRNPFQGGVGFSTRAKKFMMRPGSARRNPFQGGVGFSTKGACG